MGCLRQFKPMLIQPAPCQHPATVADGERGLGAKASHPRQQCRQGLPAARRIRSEIGHPGVDRGLADSRPGLAIPSAEIQLAPGGIDLMPPAPAAQPAADIGAALQGRGDDVMRQSLPSGGLLNPPRQALGATAMHGQIGGRANTAPGGLVRPRMPPNMQIKRHSAAPGTPAARSTRPIAGRRPGCRRCSRPGAFPASPARRR